MHIAGKRITTTGVVLLAVILAGLFLRVFCLGKQSIWLDEAWSIWMSKMSLSQIVTTPENSPPLYYLALHFWVRLFGTSAVTVRFLSVLFGVLAIPMIYLVGRQLVNEEVGLLGALILAFSSFNIWSSQEARTYSLMVLLSLFSIYLFLRLLKRSSLAISIGYVLFTALLLYTHVYGLFVLIAQNIYLITLVFLSRNHVLRLRNWVSIQAIVLALFLPWIGTFINSAKAVSTGFWIPLPTFGTIFQTFVIYSNTARLLALFLALSVFSLFAYQKISGAIDWKAPLKAFESYTWEVHVQDGTPVYFLVVLLFTVNAIPFLISRFATPIYYYKYTIAASVAFYLLVAKGISNINYRPTKLALISIIILLSVVNLPYTYYEITKPQAREAVSFIDANAERGDLVLISPDWEQVTFEYYNDRTDVAVKGIYVDAILAADDTRAKINELQSDLHDRSRVWYLDATRPTKATENFTLTILNESYVQIYTQSYVGYNIYLYEKRT